MENSRTLRLPTHLHERLSLIRSAKNKLEEKGITPSIDVRYILFLNKLSSETSVTAVYTVLDIYPISLASGSMQLQIIPHFPNFRKYFTRT